MLVNCWEDNCKETPVRILSPVYCFICDAISPSGESVIANEDHDENDDPKAAKKKQKNGEDSREGATVNGHGQK